MASHFLNVYYGLPYDKTWATTDSVVNSEEITFQVRSANYVGFKEEFLDVLGKCCLLKSREHIFQFGFVIT